MHSDEPVRELTAAVASGDAGAFGRLYDEWFDALYAEARRCTGRDESFCLDVVQDAMLRVMRAMRRLETRAELGAWLVVVVRTCAYDLLRRERRRMARELAAARARDDTRSGDEVAMLDAQQHWLRREIESMDVESAQPLLLRHRLGWTLREIGEELGLAPGAVDGRLTRSVTRLRRRAKESFGDA